jgi:hypothetical protein
MNQPMSIDHLFVAAEHAADCLTRARHLASVSEAEEGVEIAEIALDGLAGADAGLAGADAGLAGPVADARGRVADLAADVTNTRRWDDGLAARCGMLEAALDRILQAAMPIPNSASQPKSPRQRRVRNAPPNGLRTTVEAAARLGCSIKTLKGHVDAGAVRYVIIGHGSKRPRRMFTDSDLDQFIAAQTRKDSPCPSTAPAKRLTGISISSGEVIDFTVPRRSRPGVKPKK